MRRGDIIKHKEIEHYLTTNMYEPELANIYTKCAEAKIEFGANIDYTFTDEDKNNFIKLASAWSAILRKAWRIFISEKEYNPDIFWDVFIQIFVLRQHVLMDDTWIGVFKNWDRDLLNMIRKTSNPKFIEKMFIGLDYKDLRKELENND